MITYWIIGVQDYGKDGAYDVAWSGPQTKQMLWFRTIPQKDSKTAYQFPTALLDSLLPYGYSNRRWAGIALARLTQKGEGFLPLLHVHTLQVLAVELHSNGNYYQLGSGVT